MLYKSLASENINNKILSVNTERYSIRLSTIDRGLEMTLTGLSDENIIKYLTTVIMKCKFPSLTPMLLLYLLDYYTHCENFSEAGAGQ